MNVLRVCPYSRLLLAKSVSKGIKCCIYHQQLVRPSVAHLRRSCSHLALLPSLPLARLYSQKNHHFQVALKTMSLLHSALVQVLRGGHLEGIKNPEGRDSTSGLRLERRPFQFGAAYAPRWCPFPVSSTVAVVNASLAQRIGHYTASPPNWQPTFNPFRLGRCLCLSYCSRPEADQGSL
jgi:hypothetical protein